MCAVAVDEDVERFLVAALHRVAAQRGEGFLHIVAAHIDGGAALFADRVVGLPLAEQQPVFADVLHAMMRELMRQLAVIVPVEVIAQQRHGVAVGGEIVDVRAHAKPEVFKQPVAHPKQARFPFALRLRVQQMAVLFQRVAKRNGVKDGNAAPCGLRVVVQAAVVAEHVFAPPEELFRRVQILLVAGRVRHVHHRIDRVVAAAVNNLAGGTENGAVEVRISRHGNMQMDQLVAPCLQQVEDFASKLVFRNNHDVLLISNGHSGMPTRVRYGIPIVLKGHSHDERVLSC